MSGFSTSFEMVSAQCFRAVLYRFRTSEIEIYGQEGVSATGAGVMAKEMEYDDLNGLYVDGKGDAKTGNETRKDTLDGICGDVVTPGTSSQNMNTE